jgi:hypothetical protein
MKQLELMKNNFMRKLYSETQLVNRSRYRATKTPAYMACVLNEIPALIRHHKRSGLQCQM